METALPDVEAGGILKISEETTLTIVHPLVSPGWFAVSFGAT